MIAVDTNLLVYAFHPGAPEHGAARAAMGRAQAAGVGWGFTVPSVAEFWSLCTRERDGLRMATVGEAAGFLAGLHRAGGQLWQSGPDAGARLLAWAVRKRVEGRRIFDLQIALAARDNGATEIWTHDRSFVPLPGLRVVQALQ